MSGPKSLSPQIRRFPWEELPFNRPKVRVEQHRNQRPRAQCEDHDDDSFKEDDYRRRTPSFSRDRSLGHQRPSNQEEFYHRRLSPPHDGGGGRGSGGGGGEVERGRGGGEERGEGFSNESRMFEFRGRSTPASPLRLPRELLPPTPRHQSHRQQREAGTGWRREEPGRDHDSFRDPDPGPAGWSDGRRRNPPGPYGEKQSGDGRQERSPSLKRPRREQEEGGHSGFRAHEDFEDHRHMQNGFKRRHDQDAWRAPSQPLVVVEHDHGMAHGRPPSQSGPFPSGGREAEVDFGQRRSTRPSSQDRFRVLDGRHERRGDTRGNYQFDDNAERLSASSLGPGDHRKRAAHFGHGPDEPMEAYKNVARLQHLQHLQHQRQRPPQEGPQKSSYDDPADLQSWKEERRSQPWRREWPGEHQHQQQRQQQLQLPGPQLDPVMPRQRMQGWRKEEEEEAEEEEMTGEDMTVVSKETLTIKVDMSQPVHSSSPLCYSSERQLSLDLVNVGRQRLDFLPMLEHSGSHGESSARTGTFAQEIIALVHQVRDQHFSSSELTLNQRFSASQEGVTASAAEPDELTLDQRFSSSRGFSVNMDSVLDDEEPLDTSGALQPVRGPGDLRHDLERRRLERLEGVKVTICGSHVSQRPLDPISDATFEELDELEQMENGGFSSWPGKYSRRGYSHMGTRRAAPYQRDAPGRPANGPQRRNHRFGGRPGPMRRQNQRGNQSGPQW